MSAISHRPLITVAPNGARRSKAEHPRLPLSIDEIAAEAAACQIAGADAIHLHVRDVEGRHTLDSGLYREAINAIEAAAPNLAIQVTTEAAGQFSPADQLRCLHELRPADASVSIREVTQDIDTASRLYRFAAEADISIQHILYDDVDVGRLEIAFASGLAPREMRRALLVLGAYSPPRNGAPSDLPTRLFPIAQLDLDWSVCAFGAQEQACLIEAMRLGGDVRVGFENNLHRPDGALAETNAEQVAALAALRTEMKDAA